MIGMANLHLANGHEKSHLGPFGVIDSSLVGKLPHLVMGRRKSFGTTWTRGHKFELETFPSLANGQE